MIYCTGKKDCFELLGKESDIDIGWIGLFPLIYTTGY